MDYITKWLFDRICIKKCSKDADFPPSTQIIFVLPLRKPTQYDAIRIGRCYNIPEKSFGLSTNLKWELFTGKLVKKIYCIKIILKKPQENNFLSNTFLHNTF